MLACVQGGTQGGRRQVSTASVKDKDIWNTEEEEDSLRRFHWRLPSNDASSTLCAYGFKPPHATSPLRRSPARLCMHVVW